jgi:hypothetical protein
LLTLAIVVVELYQAKVYEQITLGNDEINRLVTAKG